MENQYRSQSRLPFILIGLLIGLLFAGLLWFIARSGASSTETNQQKTPTLLLSIESPKQNITTTQPNLTVIGKTGVKAVVTVIGPNETKILQDQDENFSTAVALTEGKNVIDIVAYDPVTGTSDHLTRTILYLNEDLGNL